MAIKKISEFPKVTPSADDKIIIEKNGEGGHINLSEMPVSTPVEKKISDVQKDLNDRITALAFEPGDTTGDAELKDIRKPAAGFTVPANANAGDAVRAQVTQLDEKISNLKGDLDELEGNFIESINRLNPTTITNDVIINLNTGEEQSQIGFCTSDYIKIKAGETYTSKHLYVYYGNNLAFPIYDKNKNFIKAIKPTNVDQTNNIATFTSDVNGYTRVVVHYEQNSMFVNGAEYPSNYVKYSDRVNLKENIYIDESNVENIDIAFKENLESLNFGQNEEITIEQAITVIDNYITTSGTTGEGGYHVEIANVKSGDKYRLKSETGSNIRLYVVKDASGNVSRYYGLETWGTLHDYDVTLTIEPTEDGGTLIVNTIDNNYIGVKKEETRFLINGTNIQDESIPFSKLEQNYNVLYGKKAVFDGDSICASYTDVSGKGAWAGRIGNGNNMDWKNYAVGGGTITNGQYTSDGLKRHWICENVDKLYTEYPNADYIIFEGGTNDADVIGNAITGTPEKFGSFNLTDYSGNYDATTFCGALETLFFKAIGYWPTKKIGYIVAYKMGESNNGYTKEVSNRRKYFDVAMQICNKWGIPYLNLWDGCYMNPSLTVCYDSTMTPAENREAGKLISDGQHPTPMGYEYITPMIEAWMRTL